MCFGLNEKVNLYDIVRVGKIIRPIEEYNGWRINKRDPRIDDTGTSLSFFMRLIFLIIIS